MAQDKGLSQNVWIIMIILSTLFLVWTLFVITRGEQILPTAFKLAGLSQMTGGIESKALGYMNMTMIKPLWEELWISIFGLFIVFGLRKKKKYAWTLGMFWGIMMITKAVLQGGNEIFILGWSRSCLQTYFFLVLCIIAFISFIFSKRFFYKVKYMWNTKIKHVISVCTTN